MEIFISSWKALMLISCSFLNDTFFLKQPGRATSIVNVMARWSEPPKYVTMMFVVFSAQQNIERASFL